MSTTFAAPTIRRKSTSTRTPPSPLFHRDLLPLPYSTLGRTQDEVVEHPSLERMLIAEGGWYRIVYRGSTVVFVVDGMDAGAASNVDAYDD